MVKYHLILPQGNSSNFLAILGTVNLSKIEERLERSHGDPVLQTTSGKVLLKSWLHCLDTGCP